MRAPPPVRQQLTTAEFAKARPGRIRGTHGFEAWCTISKTKKAKLNTCPRNVTILRWKVRYILISKCSDNLNSNTTDFKIQGVDGNEKILICIPTKKKDLTKDRKHYTAGNFSGMQTLPKRQCGAFHHWGAALRPVPQPPNPRPQP